MASQEEKFQVLKKKVAMRGTVQTATEAREKKISEHGSTRQPGPATAITIAKYKKMMDEGIRLNEGQKVFYRLFAKEEEEEDEETQDKPAWPVPKTAFGGSPRVLCRPPGMPPMMPLSAMKMEKTTGSSSMGSVVMASHVQAQPPQPQNLQSQRKKPKRPNNSKRKEKRHAARTKRMTKKEVVQYKEKKKSKREENASVEATEEDSRTASASREPGESMDLENVSSSEEKKTTK